METYKKSHLGSAKGHQYDESYSSGNEAYYWNRFEAPLLQNIFLQLVKDGNNKFLDIACGTGRITEIIRNSEADVTGVDISPSMLKHAKQKMPDVKFIQSDITNNSEAIEDTPDVITLFRFILNAEPPLRCDMLNAVNSILKVGGSFVVNNHYNSYSPATLRLHISRLLGRDQIAKTLSLSAMKNLLNSHGFKIRKTYGVHVIPTWHGAPLFGKAVTAFIEGILVALPPIKFLAKNIIYICEKERDIHISY